MNQDNSLAASVRSGISDNLARILAAFEAKGAMVVQSGPLSYNVPCPVHEDEDPSLTLSDGPTGVGVFCHSGCEQNEVFRAVVDFTGIPAKDFFYNPRPSSSASPPVTLAALAQAKRLPVESFTAYGMVDGVGGIVATYWSEAGNIVGTRIRRSLKASEGSYYVKGSSVSPYGAWQMPRFRPTGALILVEGETDAITGWAYNLAVLGIPGKGMARAAIRNAPGVLNGIHTIYVIQEPDDEKGAFVRGVRRALTDAGSSARVFTVKLPTKDLSQLHIERGETFMEELNKAIAASVGAASWDQPGSIPEGAIEVARWVRRTHLETFTERQAYGCLKRNMGAQEVKDAFASLVNAGWLRALPTERRAGRPSVTYCKNPNLKAA